MIIRPQTARKEGRTTTTKLREGKFHCDHCGKGVVITETLSESGQPTGDVCAEWRYMTDAELAGYWAAMGDHAEVVPVGEESQLLPEEWE